MLKNYLKIALRNLTRNKSYAFINVFGLAIGLACCILITLYIRHELSYDKFHDNYETLYRVVESVDGDSQTTTYATTYSALAPALTQVFSGIKHSTHVYPTSGLITGPGNLKYQEEGMVYVDSIFFDMFSFELVSGDPTTALNKPLSMVLTEKTALKYFGQESPIGKTLSFRGTRNTFEYEITGVAKNPPENSHIQFDILISYESLRSMRPWEYNVRYHPPMYTYVQLNSQEDAETIEAGFEEFASLYYGERNNGANNFSLQPVSDIHLYSNLQNELSVNFDITYIYLFAAIAAFILVIACINFLNLATARSLKRSREVGMRKTLGAYRGQLIGQFLGEAFVMTAVALGAAVLMLEVLMPYFNQLAGKSLASTLFADWSMAITLIGIIGVVGLIAGSYPAFYLSSFKPIQSLKGNSTKEKISASFFRKGLVMFQFFISTALIFATIIITNQLDFIKNERLGFDKERVVIVPIRETSDQFNVEALKQEVLRIPGVDAASAVSGVPGIGEGIHGFYMVPEGNKADSLVVQTLTVDHDYAKTLDLNVIAGRDFSKEYSTDETSGFLINETLAQKMGWENPIDKELTLRFYTTDPVIKKGKVIGLVEDFQYHSLHNSIDPVLIQVFSATFYHDYLTVRLNTDNVQNTIAGIRDKWQAFNPERPLEYFFLDDTFDALYESETKLSYIFNVFAGIAIFIACLGLFGLASYSTEQRFKEIGIRKVMGARISDIVGLLGKDFTLLILISQVFALPIAYALMNGWLNDFAYRIDISVGLFLISSVSVLMIAWITISYQSIKAATANPIKSLRSE